MASLAYFKGIQEYAPGYFRPLGVPFTFSETRHCPGIWHRRCRERCFGTFSGEGMTEDQIIRTAISHANRRGENIIVFEPATYKKYKTSIDTWIAAHPAVEFGLGLTMKNVTRGMESKHCFKLSYGVLPTPGAESVPAGKEYVFEFSKPSSAVVWRYSARIVQLLGGKKAYVEDENKFVVVM